MAFGMVPPKDKTKLLTGKADPPTHIPEMLFGCEYPDRACAEEVSYPANMLGWYPPEAIEPGDNPGGKGRWLCDSCAESVGLLVESYPEWQTYSLHDWLLSGMVSDKVEKLEAGLSAKRRSGV